MSFAFVAVEAGSTALAVFSLLAKIFLITLFARVVALPSALQTIDWSRSTFIYSANNRSTRHLIGLCDNTFELVLVAPTRRCVQSCKQAWPGATSWAQGIAVELTPVWRSIKLHQKLGARLLESSRQSFRDKNAALQTLATRCYYYWLKAFIRAVSLAASPGYLPRAFRARGVSISTRRRLVDPSNQQDTAPRGTTKHTRTSFPRMSGKATRSNMPYYDLRARGSSEHSAPRFPSARSSQKSFPPPIQTGWRRDFAPEHSRPSPTMQGHRPYQKRRTGLLSPQLLRNMKPSRVRSISSTPSPRTPLHHKEMGTILPLPEIRVFDPETSHSNARHNSLNESLRSPTPPMVVGIPLSPRPDVQMSEDEPSDCGQPPVKDAAKIVTVAHLLRLQDILLKINGEFARVYDEPERYDLQSMRGFTDAYQTAADVIDLYGGADDLTDLSHAFFDTLIDLLRSITLRLEPAFGVFSFDPQWMEFYEAAIRISQETEIELESLKLVLTAQIDERACPKTPDPSTAGVPHHSAQNSQAPSSPNSPQLAESDESDEEL